MFFFTYAYAQVNEEQIYDVNNTYNISTEILEISGLEDMIYSGEKIEPNITLKFMDNELIEGKDYTIQYKDNQNVGKATIYVQGIGDFSGLKELSLIYYLKI